MDKSDFDELDRAVQSLVADSGTANTQPVSTPEPSAPVSNPAPVAPVDVPSTPAPAPEPSAAPAVQPQPAAEGRQAATVVQRPRGRFMDIVPPRKESVKAPTKSPSRTGVDLTPTSQPAAPAPEPVVETPAPVAPEPATVDLVPPADQPVIEEPAAPELAPTPEMPSQPELIDDQPDMGAPSGTDTESAEDQDDFDREIASIANLDEPESSAHNSPFIDGANVEKRPLGKGLDAAAPSEIVDPVDSIEKEPDTNLANPQSVTPPVEEPQPQAKPKKLARNKMKGAKVSPAPAEASGPTSINQQYQVKPDDQPADSAGSSMYDASNYTQPLAHPAKKKSGWLGVLWIVLLLAVGGGGAFVVYQLGLF